MGGGVEFFRLSPSTTARYVRLVEEKWKADAEATSHSNREWHRKRLIAGMRAANGKNQHASAARYQELLMRIDGVAKPQECRSSTPGESERVSSTA